MTRAEHLEWAKERALEYLEAGDPKNAIASLISDLGKHAELATHPGVPLGGSLLFGGRLRTVPEVRHWIEGFR